MSNQSRESMAATGEVRGVRPTRGGGTLIEALSYFVGTILVLGLTVALILAWKER